MNISSEVLPKEILTLYEEAEFENTGGIYILQVRYVEDDVIVDFQIDEGNEMPKHRWCLTIGGAKLEKIVRSWISEIEVCNDHYLIWEFTDEHTELYVNGPTKNTPEYIGSKFYQLHQAEFGKFLPLETYINGTGLFFAVEMKQGIFAQGPKKVLRRYEEWLTQIGKPAYLFESNKLTANNAEREDLNLKIIFFGKSYFIGERFDFEKVI